MRKKMVLVIDDDEMNLQIAKMILERKAGCEVIGVTSGMEGVEFLRGQHVDLVLLDVLMPDKDGIETLQEIRADATIAGVLVMMLTASGDMDNVKRAAELGVKDYIKKPFMPADLIERVKTKLAVADKRIKRVLVIGDDADAVKDMKAIIEENFSYEALSATDNDAAKEILDEYNIASIIACADMKFVDGFRTLKMIASDEKFSAVPFALTTADKLREVLDKINPPEVEEPPPVEVEETPAEVEEPPAVEPVPDSAVTRKEKKKIANVVTNLIGYELDVRV